MFNDRQRPGLYKALGSTVMRNLTRIDKLWPVDIAKLRKTLAPVVEHLTVEIRSEGDLRELANELPHWTALQSLHLEGGNTTSLSSAEPDASLLQFLLGELTCQCLTYTPSGRRIDGDSARDITRLTQHVSAQVQQVILVPAYKTTLAVERDIDGAFGKARYHIEAPRNEYGEPHHLVVSAWLAAHSEFGVDIQFDGPIYARATTDTLDDLQELTHHVPQLRTLRVHGAPPASMTHLTGRLPQTRFVDIDNDSDHALWVERLDPLIEVRGVRAVQYSIKAFYERNAQGRLEVSAKPEDMGPKW
jgi:hypothetical protein